MRSVRQQTTRSYRSKPRRTFILARLQHFLHNFQAQQVIIDDEHAQAFWKIFRLDDRAAHGRAHGGQRRARLCGSPGASAMDADCEGVV